MENMAFIQIFLVRSSGQNHVSAIVGHTETQFITLRIDRVRQRSRVKFSRSLVKAVRYPIAPQVVFGLFCDVGSGIFHGFLIIFHGNASFLESMFLPETLAQFEMEVGVLMMDIEVQSFLKSDDGFLWISRLGQDTPPEIVVCLVPRRIR